MAGAWFWGINTVPYALGMRHTPPPWCAVVRRPSTHPPQSSLPNDFELQQHHWNGLRQYSYWQHRIDSFAALSGEDNVLGAGDNDIVDLGGGNDSVNFTDDTSGATIYGQKGNDSLGITVLQHLHDVWRWW